MKTAILFVLLTITGNGHVSYVKGFHSQSDCLNAANVALYGETIKEGRRIDNLIEKRDAETEKAKQVFMLVHPEFAPRNQIDEDYLLRNPIDAKNAIKLRDSICKGCKLMRIEETMHLREMLPQDDNNQSSGSYYESEGQWPQYRHDSFVIKGPNDIKKAYCIPEKPHA